MPKYEVVRCEVRWGRCNVRSDERWCNVRADVRKYNLRADVRWYNDGGVMAAMTGDGAI